MWIGGPQSHAFILYPVPLPAPAEPIVGAEKVHDLLRGRRDATLDAFAKEGVISVTAPRS